jgi:hypothetical protein
MGCNTSPARIEFPARFLDDELRKCLEDHEDVEFKDGQPVSHTDDSEVDVTDGLFNLYHSEVCYGMFEDLEDLLVKKHIPFERQTSADWDIVPCLRVFRPNFNPFPAVDSPDFNREFILNPETDEPCVSLKDIRELLTIGDAGEEAAAAIRRYLDDHFPVYPPLSDYVEATHAMTEEP